MRPEFCEFCLNPADHAHPPCGHCHGTGRCGLAFCPKCADPRFDDLPFPCGTCMWCAGEGVEHEASVPIATGAVS